MRVELNQTGVLSLHCFTVLTSVILITITAWLGKARYGAAWFPNGNKVLVQKKHFTEVVVSVYDFFQLLLKI